jgi:cell division protein FtsW
MASKRTVYAGGAVARYLLLGSVFGLTVFGLVMIYSASSITASVREGSAAHFFLRQLLFAVVAGVFAMWLSTRDYRTLKARAFSLWVITAGLLLLTMGVGFVRGGARRWIDLGVTSIQPSEFAKIACVILVCAFAVEWQRDRLTTSRFLAKVAVCTVLPALAIVFQPDLGTTITLLVAVSLVLFLAGIPLRYMAIAAGVVVAVGAGMIAGSPMRLARMTAFLDPWSDRADKGYQSVQALLAFGSGGIDGVGLGLSRQKFFYLPEAHTDFILAIIGEEIGLLGTGLLVLGFAVFIYAGLRVSAGAKDPFGRLLSGALTGMLGFQAFLNIAAVTGMMPVTGKPLPFISYGGSSMLVTMICVGLLLSVSRYGALAPRPVRMRTRNEGAPREGVHEWRGNRRPRPPRAERGRSTARRA